jgi:hypothetical protein
MAEAVEHALVGEDMTRGYEIPYDLFVHEISFLTGKR